jgi:predicted dehydrogenase
MPLRFGLVTAAHLHVWSYVDALKSHPEAEIASIWDHDAVRGQAFAQKSGVPYVDTFDDLLDSCDAVVIVSENNIHAEFGIAAAKAGKHILCEKPLVTNEEDGDDFIAAAKDSGVKLMTAFPCRFSPAYRLMKDRIAAGEIGAVKAICATNRGRCPFGWFVDADLSGGGSMIDHVVHVGDLLRDLTGEEPARVEAQIGSNVYGQTWEDTAMLTIEFPSGIFASLDSSWSRPSTYKTWGDVTMNVVGEKGVIELDMFGQEAHQYRAGEVTYTSAGFGSNLDALMVNEFIRACLDDREPLVTGTDGLQAAKIALAGYRSVASNGHPAALA